MKYLKTFLENNNYVDIENIIKTVEFKTWFAGSKIVNNNEPMIMYHGSSKNFDTFDFNSEKNERTNNFAGFYFTPDKSYAERFAKNIYKCFLKIKNPLYTNKTKPSKKAIAYIAEKYKDQYDERYIKDKLLSLKEGRWWVSFMTGEDSTQMAIIDGFDGYIDGTDVCAFHPNQIKLADGINTKFSDSSNIREKIEGELISEDEIEDVVYPTDVEITGHIGMPIKKTRTQKLGKKPKKTINENKINKFIVYHGSDVDIEEFNYSYIGKGVDQYGPGFYFTNDYNEAKNYGKIINKYELTLNNIVSSNKKPSRTDIVELIKNAPNYVETLRYFDENKFRAMGTAINLFSKNDQLECFISIWADFYLKQGNSSIYLLNLVKLGYDGHIIKSKYDDNVKYIMFNNKNIKLISNNNI